MNRRGKGLNSALEDDVAPLRSSVLTLASVRIAVRQSSCPPSRPWLGIPDDLKRDRPMGPCRTSDFWGDQISPDVQSCRRADESHQCSLSVLSKRCLANNRRSVLSRWTGAFRCRGGGSTCVSLIRSVLSLGAGTSTAGSSDAQTRGVRAAGRRGGGAGSTQARRNCRLSSGRHALVLRRFMGAPAVRRRRGALPRRVRERGGCMDSVRYSRAVRLAGRNTWSRYTGNLGSL
jgi:hypothetical protein